MPGLLASKTSQKAVPRIQLQPVWLVAVKIASLMVFSLAAMGGNNKKWHRVTNIFETAESPK